MAVMGIEQYDDVLEASLAQDERRGPKKLDRSLSGFLRFDHAAIATGLCS